MTTLGSVVVVASFFPPFLCSLMITPVLNIPCAELAVTR